MEKRCEMGGGGKGCRKEKTHAYNATVLDVSLHLLLIVGEGGDGIVGEEHVSLWEG